MGVGTRRSGLNSGAEPTNPERGAAMVELAFVLVLLVMLLVGTVSGAIALSRNNSIQNAAREASRFGATLPDGGTAAWFTDVRDVARSAAVGDLDASVSNEEICIAFITAEDVATHVIDNGGVLSGVSGGKCPGFDDGRDGNSEARVNVVVQRDTAFNVVVFSNDLTLVAEAGARYER
jgi:Flp pilus assembly protein TadG